MTPYDKINKIKQLREETGLGLAEAKRIIETAPNEDYGEALRMVREKRLQRPDRTAASKREGIIYNYVHMDYIGVMIEVNCDSSALAKCDDFRNFCKNLCVHIAAASPYSVEKALEQEYVKDASITVREFIKEYSSKVNERVELVRFTRMQTLEGQNESFYR